MRARARHFNPGNAGCQVAMDARFLALSDNASVATWASRPGGLYGATAAGTAQPTFKASSINGRPAVQFDGTSDCMDFEASVLGLTNAASGLVVIVVAVCDNAAADAAQNVVFISSNSATSSTRFAMRACVSSAASLSGAGRRLDADTLAATTNITGTASPAVLQVYADWSGNSLQARLNGGSPVSSTFSSGAGSTSALNSLAAKLGGQATGANRLSGRIAAVAIGSPLLAQPLRMRIRQHYGFSFKIATA